VPVDIFLVSSFKNSDGTFHVRRLWLNGAVDRGSWVFFELAAFVMLG
jgi:hypothetical protein